jgi:hypothetical protein
MNAKCDTDKNKLLEIGIGIYRQPGGKDTLFFLIRDLAHFAQTLAGASETVLELEDFDLSRGYILASDGWDTRGRGRRIPVAPSRGP